MKNLKYGALARLGFGLSILSVAALLNASKLMAQDLDDSLESELDSLSTTSGGSSDAPATSNSVPKSADKKSATSSPGQSKPAEDDLDATDGFADEEPLKDPFEGEKSELAPLESPKTHPEKAAKAAKPMRSEPTVQPESASKATAKTEMLAPTSDEPNSAFESRLAAIYATAEPVSDEKWSGLLGSRAAESYSVQAGDTLWDLSQTLFADGFYWSKLWAENPEIQNPHQISKGQAIRFIGGTEATPPEVRVVKEEPDQLTIQTQAAFEKEDVVPALQEAKQDEISSVEIKQQTKFQGMTPNRALNQAPYYQEDIEGKITQADLEAGVVVEQSEIVPRPILPPPSEERRKVLLNIPRSFKEFKFKHFEREVTVQRKNNISEKVPGASVPPFLAFEKLPEPLGTVAEVPQADVASLGQVVIIKGNEPLTVGSKVYTVTPRFKLRSPVNGGVGHAVEVGGILRIDEHVNEGENIYRATVVFGVNAVRVDSMVLGGEPPRVPVTTKGRRIDKELTVIGGSYSDTSPFFGDGASVFLDVQDSGVQVGDVLAVQARRGERRRTIAPNYREPIGVLKVFAVSGQVASAFVVVATEEIRPGDKTGPSFPKRLPDLRNEPPRITRSAAAN